jgi:NAD(P)-dependent dehydrogenase (short-subunit alcohol dehydrogenase family)
MTFQGRTAIVTGATDGIGLATSRLLAAQGAQLVLVARRPEPGAALVAELGEQRAVFLSADVADPGTPDAAVAAARDRFGAVDILVNNAALDFVKPILEATPEDVQRVYEMNVFAPLRMLQAAARAMLGRGGAIVNVTSRLATIAIDSINVYGSAKAALAGLTRGAAIEFAAEGIRVNAVAPGLTETPLIQAWISEQDDPDAFRADLAGSVPLKRLATPEEVAAAIAFLASDAAGHITGASLAIDGGYTAQ